MTTSLPPFKLVAIADLQPYDRNARTHSAEQIAQIARSIEQFGFTNPLLIDAGGGIIAGNSLILFLAWRSDSLTRSLLVTSVITSIVMAAVGVLACAAPARRALRIQPTEALREA